MICLKENLERLCQNNVDLFDLLTRYGAWEGKLVDDPRCWEVKGFAVAIPQDLFDELMKIQDFRQEVMDRLTTPPDEEAVTLVCGCPVCLATNQPAEEPKRARPVRGRKVS